MKNIDRNNLHHAYGIVRSETTVTDLLAFFERELKLAVTGNPDFFHGKFETLTIDDSRRIKDFAQAKKFSVDLPRIFLLELYAITHEAQNALLKLFEEPEVGNHFFLVVPSFDILLPTLRSRLSLQSLATANGASVGNIDIEAFLTSSLKEKIAFVDALAADISDEKKLKHEALTFLNDLEKSLYVAFAKNRSEHAAVFKAIARARTYMNDRAPSVKMLLEYVVLTV
ncbi:MAG: hypothetical protein WCQ60_02640 [bacterium]